MVWWPEYEVLEREGRLLVGPSPRVREGNRVGLGTALLFIVPIVVTMFWFMSDTPRWVLLSVGLISAAGGAWSFRQAMTGDFELHESRDLAFDRAGNRVTRKGTVVCALSDITAVGVKSYPSDDGPPDELTLCISPGGSSEQRVVLFKSLGSELEEPASRIAAYLDVPRRDL